MERYNSFPINHLRTLCHSTARGGVRLCGFPISIFEFPTFKRVRGFLPFSQVTSHESPVTSLFCPFCPLLSGLFSYKYKLPILQLFCFDNDANCPGAGYPPKVRGAKVLLELDHKEASGQPLQVFEVRQTKRGAEVF